MKKLPRGDAMDDYLATLGLCRKPTAKDGSCLFRAVSEQLFGAQSYHLRVRQACIEFLEKNKFEFSQFVDGPFDHYLYRLQNSKEWAGQVEISALSLMYKHDFIVYQDIRRPPVNVSQNGYKEKIYLCFSDGNHYDSVYPLNYCSSAALCQSILYEILYKNVFKMENPVDQGVEMMSTKSHKTRKDSVSSVSDKADSPTPESPTDSSELDSSTDSNKDGKVDRKSEHHSLPFPYRVAKALDPGIYRNVEYDIWLEGKKEQKREQQWTDCHYTPGDKCQVTLEEQPDKVYHAHIQEITPDKGPVTVFIEELGEKHKVPFSSLKPLPQSYHQGWAMVPGKSYKQLSGYYQKAPITEQDSQNMGKKKNRRKKEVPMMLPGLGRGQPLPPRLQNQQGDSPSKSQGLGRSTQLTGMRNPPPRFATQQSLINAASRPVKSHWSHQDNHGRGGRQRQNSGGRHNSGPTQNSVSADVDGEKQIEEEPVIVHDIQERDPSAFPALPNRSRHDSGPRSFWDNGGVPDGGGGAQHDYDDGCRSGSVTPPLPGSGSMDGYQYQVSAGQSCSSPVPSPSTPATPTATTPYHPSGSAHGFIPPPGNFPFYPFLVIPHMDNLAGPVNYNVGASRDPSGADLPYADPSTLRFFFNLGYEYYRMSSLIQMQQQQQYAAYMNGQMLYTASGPAQPADLVPAPADDDIVHGYFPSTPGSPGSTAASTPQGPVYYNQGYAATQAYMPYQPPQPPPIVYTNGQHIQYTQYGPPPAQYTVSV